MGISATAQATVQGGGGLNSAYLPSEPRILLRYTIRGTHDLNFN